MNTRKEPNTSITLPLDWHGKRCPSCFEGHGLEVSFVGTARLTRDGSADCGDHEWGENSHCTCTCCGFNSKARIFDMDFDADEDGKVTLPIHDPYFGDRSEDEEDVDTILLDLNLRREAYEHKLCGNRPPHLRFAIEMEDNAAGHQEMVLARYIYDLRHVVDRMEYDVDEAHEFAARYHHLTAG